MWRAEVVERLSAEWVRITIPSLYRDAVVGPVSSAVDAIEGSRVVVADLTPGAKVHDWWVVGFESQEGRWAEPAPHTHPQGQVEGLVDALAAKADTTALADKADVTALATKADAPGVWTSCTVSGFLTPSQPEYPVLAARSTPVGMQLSGRCLVTADTARDVVAFTLPAGFTAPYPIMFNASAMGPGGTTGTDYAALTYQFEIRTDRTVTTREPLTGGSRISFNQTVIL